MKKRLLKVVASCVWILLSSSSYGQSVLQNQPSTVVAPPEKCASALIHEQRLENDPAYALRAQEIETFIANYEPEKVGGVYRIPVVVHVVYYNSGLGTALFNITDDQIRDAIKKLNRQNRNLTGSPSVDTDIEFSLAVKDPSGNCTSGITRDNAQTAMSASVYTTYSASGVAAATGTGISDAQIKAVNQWNATQYFNIWLIPEFDNNGGGAGVQGYASLAPSHGTTSDGSVMLGIDFIDPFSTTLVHELGHSFNLYHTFQGDGSGATCPTDVSCGVSGDCCADTPPHMRSNSVCLASGTNSCTGGSNSLFVYNYMDYSTCPDRFTANQVTRMQASASGTRGSFLAANGNTKLVPPVGGATVTAVRAEQTSVCLGSTIQLFDATSCSPNDYLNQTTTFPGFTYSWSVTNGTQTYTSTNQNPVFTPAVGTYSVTLTVTHASFGTITSTTPAVFTVVPAAVSACSPASTNLGNYQQTVSRVKFNTIDNNTNTLSTDGYQNFVCTINTSVIAGSIYPLVVNINSGGSGIEYVEVDIDWNNDGDFVDIGESNLLSGNTATTNASVTITQNITIPAGAVQGALLRMRVMGETSSVPSAAKQTCSSAYLAGDIEDYGIYVQPSVVCPTVASSPASLTICQNANTTLAATFNNSPASFVWQISTNSGGSWTNLTNVAPYSNVTTASMTITAAGTALSGNQYRCVATNTCGSVNSTASTLTVTASPTAPTISAGGPLTFCSGGSVILTSSSATGNTWSTAATTQNITVTTSGSYTVTRTVSGCTSLASTATVVTVNPVPTAPTVSAGGPLTFCTGGSVVLTSSVATGNTWSTGATTQSITVTTAGNYTVTQTVSGCTSPASAVTAVVVNPIPTAPTISAGGPLTFCSGGSVVLTSSSATGNTWSTAATTQNITATTSGSYTVTRTVSGCTSPASAATVVTVNPIPTAPTISAGGPLTFCTGGSVVLTSSVATGNTWSTGATTQNITVTTAGNYTVTQTVSGCTSPASDVTAVVVNTIPTAPTISAGGPLTFCSGGSVVLTSSSATGNTWSTAATTQNITATTSGSYTVTRTVSGCTSPASAATVVTVNPTPTAPTISAGGPLSFCTGGNVVLTSSATTGNTWSTGATTQSITVSASGNYTVTQTVSGCTSPASAVTAVTVSPVPTAPTISAGGPLTFCSGGSVVLTSSSATGNTWSTAATTQNITVTTSGNYTVIRTVSGCTSPASAATVVTVNPTPTAPTISAGGPLTFCSGGNVVLTSSAATGNTWSTSATTQNITATTSGSYTVTRTVSGCTSPASAATVVTVNPIPTAPTISSGGPLTFCSGGNVVLTSSSTTGNIWSTGATTQNITVSASGNYTVTQTVSGCTSPSSAATSVTVNPIPTAPTISAGGPLTFCSGGNVVLTSSSATGNTWSTGATTQNITVSASGNYTVTQTVSGCTSPSSAATSVTVNPIPTAPTISAGGPLTFCSGGNVVLTSSSATGNTWSTGATTQNITISASGNYTVIQTVSGCTSLSSSAIVVTVNPIPTAPTISASGPLTFCSGGNVVLTSSASTGNTWSTGEITPSITVSSSGNITVTQTLSGCTSPSSSATAVTVNPIPTAPIISAGGPLTFCSGGNVVLTSSASTGNTWSTGETTQNITVNTSGNITVTQTLSGCTSPLSTVTSVTVNPTPSAPTISAGGPLTFCSGGNVMLTSSSATGNTWSTGETTQNITVSTSGNYTVTETLGACTSSASATTAVTVNPTPAITFGVLTDPSTCFATDGSISLTGSGSGDISWFGISTGTLTGVTLPTTIASLGAGSYTISFLSAAGCVSNTLNTSLSDPLPPFAPIISAGGPTTFCLGDSVILTSTAGSGNTWSTGETTSSITVLSPGTYTVTQTSGACISGSSNGIAVTVNTPTTPTFVSVGPFCEGTLFTLPTNSTNGIAGTWSPGIDNTNTTTYTFVPTTGQCATNATETVVIDPLPAVSFASVPTLCVYNSPVTLTQGSPAGGIYSGTGISGDDFDPAIAGVGNTTITYAFTNGNGCTGTAQSIVTVDGCVGISENETVFINVYPNPSTGILTINAGGLMIQSVHVYDALGQLVFELKNTESSNPQIDLTKEASGMYTLRIQTESGAQHIPLIIEK